MGFWDFFKKAPATPPRPRTFTLENEEGAKSLQSFLADLGYLDPPADGRWGGTSIWALGRVLVRTGIVAGAEVSLGCAPGHPLHSEVVAALGRAKPLPFLKAVDPLLDRTIRGMQAAGAWIAREPGCYNIVSVEGHMLDGTKNDDKRDVFNDWKGVFSFDESGAPTFVGKWRATTTPGQYWTANPMRADGAFNIGLGQQKCWTPGDYHGRALLQNGVIRGYRDRDRKGIRDLAHPWSGDDSGVHHHQGYNSNRNAMGHASAGCQVINMTADQEQFMTIALRDKRHIANNGYRYAATVLGQSQLPEV